MEIREDLKTNPEYLNQIIQIQNSSLKTQEKEIKRLMKLLGSEEQSALIELEDKVEMLNRRFFTQGAETLKTRPPKNYDKELLPHNTPPVEVTNDKRVDVPEVEIEHSEVGCSCCECPILEKIITAKGAAKIKKGSRYSIDFCVSTAVDKFSYHLPLESKSSKHPVYLGKFF